jgi:hypothetical protein
MKLDQQITIYPPPYTDASNKLVTPDPIVLDSLDVIYSDYPSKKLYYVRIDRIPNPVYLFTNENYDNAGIITREVGEIKLKEIIGNNPEKFLRSLFPKTLEEHPNGPGSILSSMIKTLGIVMTAGCSCRQHAIEMNEKGNDWCEANIDTIVGWLRTEAKKRSLPFIDAIGKLMVARAIKKSRRLLANQPVPVNDEELDNM